nr:MAG TPA: hypothetical protein [Caudoviricetes sp.]DAJ80579.1 MAG TPA: hypothetical protein [Caudoviricetes sp.]
MLYPSKMSTRELHTADRAVAAPFFYGESEGEH